MDGENCSRPCYANLKGAAARTGLTQGGASCRQIARAELFKCRPGLAGSRALRALKLSLFGLGAFLLAGVGAYALDNGDGTYSNPMIHADHPDCEIIRVGDDYYYLTSSFHLVPANPIMHSKDLVNWECIGHTIPKYDVGDKRHDMEGGSRYGAGSWRRLCATTRACSIPPALSGIGKITRIPRATSWSPAQKTLERTGR